MGDNMKKIILLGCGGHAKSIVDVIESKGIYKIVGFIGKDEDKSFIYRDYKVIGSDQDLDFIYGSGVANAFVSIGFMGEGKIRNNLYEQIKHIGFNIPSIIDDTAVISADAIIGEGTFVGKNAVVNSDSVVGKMSIINTAAIVEHDCNVGDFSHISVSTVLCGNVCVGSNSFIGANSTIIQGKKLGNNVIVGAGSTVLTDLSDNKRVFGIVKRDE